MATGVGLLFSSHSGEPTDTIIPGIICSPSAGTTNSADQDYGDEGGAHIPDIPVGRRIVFSHEYDQDVVLPESGHEWTEDEAIAVRRPPSAHPELRHVRKTSLSGIIEDDHEDATPPEQDGQAKQDGRPGHPAFPPPPRTRAPSAPPHSPPHAAMTTLGLDLCGKTLPALQTYAAQDTGNIEPLAVNDFDPGCFDLVAPAEGNATKAYSLEKRAELLFSGAHLKAIVGDQKLLQHFATFLRVFRPSSPPLLAYYLDTVKALRAITYSNTVLENLGCLPSHEFASDECRATANGALEERSAAAFDALTREDLPAYVTHVWIQIVNASVRSRISGTLPAHLMELSEGLAEVFCLTDPSRQGNPIIFASEEFHRTTQYGSRHAMGRNCRFLQGPETNPFSIERIRAKLDAGKEHCETILNYRRDGSPFLSLLMVAPLHDSRGMIRYFIGAQCDVSGLAKECAGLEAFQRAVNTAEGYSPDGSADAGGADPFRDLSELFNTAELQTVRRHGGTIHRARDSDGHEDPTSRSKRSSARIILEDDSHLATADDSTAPPPGSSNGGLTGVYENYVLVRPYPSLRILFTSPSLRLPGVLQSHFLSKIGGSRRVRDNLELAFAEGRGVTAKVLWVTRAGSARRRWIHCTPLLAGGGAVGAWMVVLVDDADGGGHATVGVEPPSVEPLHGAHASDDDGMSLASLAATNQLAADANVLLSSPAYGERQQQRDWPLRR